MLFPHCSQVTVLMDSAEGIEVFEYGHILAMQFTASAKPEAYPHASVMLRNFIAEKSSMMQVFDKLDFHSQIVHRFCPPKPHGTPEADAPLVVPSPKPKAAFVRLNPPTASPTVGPTVCVCAGWARAAPRRSSRECAPTRPPCRSEPSLPAHSALEHHRLEGTRSPAWWEGRGVFMCRRCASQIRTRQS